MVPPHKSQELYQALIETTGTGYVVIDESGKVLDANQEYVRLAGYRLLNEIRGRSVIEWAAAYEKEKNSNAVKKCLREGHVRGFEVDYVDGVGKITTIEVNATVVEEEGAKHILALCRDITERKRIEFALRQAEGRLRSIIHVAPIGIGMVSDRVLLQVNDLLCQMTGYSPDELIGKSARVLYPSDEEFDFVGKEKYVQINSTGSGTVETKWRRKDGEIIDIFLSSTALDRNDLTVGVIFTALDITERKRSEQALRDNEERFRRIFDKSPLGMITAGQDFRFLRTNPAFCAMIGYAERELIGLTFKDLTHPDDLGHDIDNITKLFRGEISVYRTEKRYIRKDKHVVWANTTVSLIRDKDGKFLYYLVMIEDITERKKAEQELLEWRKRYELVSAASGQLVYDCDLSTGVIVWGGSIQKVLGYRPEEMTGGIEQRINLIDPVDCDRAVRLLKMAERNFLSYEVEYNFRHKNGHYVKILDRGFFIPVPGGKPERMVGTMQDITSRKETEEQLRQAYEQLKKTQRELIENEKMAALGRFAAGIAHEMKNPLGIMLGGLEFLERTVLGQEAGTKDAIAKIKSAILRGDAIIQNLLTYSRPSENKVSKIKAADLVNETLASFKYKAAPRRAKIKTRFDDTVYVEVDAPKIHQVLFNLLDNAMDAITESGQIEVRAYQSVILDFSSEPACVIEVVDNGIGIADDNLPKLFEPFFTTKLETKGTGLGLFMAKSIIDSHGGKIAVVSEPGKGTTVKIILKQAVP